MDGPPTELVEMIADLLPARDALSTRLVWKKFAAPGINVLANNVSRLYLHPTRMREIIEVCHHPKLCNSITEIAIVGRTHWPAHSEAKARRLPHLDDHAWQGYALDDVDELLATCTSLPEDEDALFCFRYEALIEALKKLKHLDSNTYTGKCEVFGLCGVTLNTIMAHAFKVQGVARNFVGESDERVGESDEETPTHLSQYAKAVRWSDTEMMAGIIMSGIAKFANVSIEQDLPRGESVKWTSLVGPNYQSQPPSFLDPITAGFHKISKDITNFTILLIGREEHIDYFTKWLSSMQNLQSLALGIVSRSWYTGKRFAGVIGKLSCPGPIKSLEICSDEMAYVPTTPMANLIDRLQSSLKTLKMRNTIVSDQMKSPWYVGLFLDFLKVTTRVERIELEFCLPVNPVDVPPSGLKGGLYQGGWQIEDFGGGRWSASHICERSPGTDDSTEASG